MAGDGFILPAEPKTSKIVIMKNRLLRPALPLLIVLLAFGLRLHRLDFQSIWWDEGHSIFVAEHPIAQIPTIPAMDVHPPAYFALLHGWMTLAGRSEFALRYLSVIFSVLTVALLWRFAADLSRRRAAALTALLAALSPLYVAYAQEVRSYALFTVITLTATFALWQILRAGRTSRRLLALYIVSGAASLYVHYFTIFLLTFHNLAWLVWIIRAPALFRRWRMGRWLTAQIGIALLFTPQLLLAVRQITSYTNPNLMPPSVGYFIGQSWRAYTVGLNLDPDPARWGMLAIAATLLIGGAGLALSKWKLPDAAFLTAWLVVPLAVYFAALQRQPSFEPRYMISVTPALFLLMGLPAALTLPRPWRAGWPVFLTILPVVALTVALYSYYTNEAYFKDDSAGVANWLAAETTTNDIVYIDVPHPFHYYTERGNIAAPARYLFVDIHTAANTLTAEAAGRARLFWITWRGSDTDPRGVIPFLAEKYGRQLGQRDFRGYRAVWFSLPADLSAFDLPTDPSPVQAVFGDAVQLDGAAFGPAAAPGDTAWVTLHFSLLRPVDVDYRVSLRLRADDGRVVAQVDKDLLNDRHFRTAAWPAADLNLNQALNVYTLPIAPDAPPGLYRLEAVLYNAEPPYPSEGVSGSTAAPDGLSAWTGQITVN